MIDVKDVGDVAALSPDLNPDLENDDLCIEVDMNPNLDRGVVMRCTFNWRDRVGSVRFCRKVVLSESVLDVLVTNDGIVVYARCEGHPLNSTFLRTVLEDQIGRGDKA